MATLQEITAALQQWLTERTGTPMDPDDRYLELGTVDSFHVMELVIFAERRFGLTFSSSDLANPEFGTIAGLARLIQSKASGT